jgi:FdrA protein
MIVENIVRANSYADSVFLMSLANRTERLSGISEASVLMGTPENKALLRDAGLLTAEGEKARPDDLIIALRAVDEGRIKPAVKQIRQWMAERLTSAATEGEQGAPRTLGTALDRMPQARLVLISVPGRYAAWEAQTALKGGRNVMIFSDNVSLEDEVALKKEAAGRDLMVMGPDCGTTILGGKVLGFGNVVRRGNIGIAGASGTGIQEICSLLDRFDEGISQAIGLGGRDLSEPVGGLGALQAIRLLQADESTELILFLSKPPHPQVAGRIVNALAQIGKPGVVCFQGGLGMEEPPRPVAILSLVEDAVMHILRLKGKDGEVAEYWSDVRKRFGDRPNSAASYLTDEQRYLRGLFSGGSLCAEAGVILSTLFTELHTNIDLPGARRLDDASISRGHTLVDLGADQFTAGVPHPMIDFTVRNRRIIQEAKDPQTAVILFDIVLGYGAHPDPAGAILPALREARRIAEKRDNAICLVASLCGTRGDPQGSKRQRKMLQDSGVTVFSSIAQAARYAGQVVLREKGTEWKASQPGPLDGSMTRMKEKTASPPGHSLLQQPLQVINLGLSTFADALNRQDVPVLQVDWRPPAHGDKRLLEVLGKLR